MSRSGRPRAVLSRRALLAAACGLPVLAACTKQQEFPHPGPDVVVREGLLTTRHWPRHRPHWIVMRPRGVARPPVIVSLHGKNADAWSTFHALGAQRYIPSTGVAVAAIDGGNYYWHARRSESTGADDVSPDTPPCDTGAMVVDDFVPLLGRLGLEVSRVAMMGWSMGGYGALLLSAQVGSSRVAGVAPMSAALWPEPAPRGRSTMPRTGSTTTSSPIARGSPASRFGWPAEPQTPSTKPIRHSCADSRPRRGSTSTRSSIRGAMTTRSGPRTWARRYASWRRCSVVEPWRIRRFALHRKDVSLTARSRICSSCCARSEVSTRVACQQRESRRTPRLRRC